VQLVQERGDTAALSIVVHEGRNRQVRRMCDAIGHPVRRLVRTRIGPLADRKLAPGSWRELRPDEVRALSVAAASDDPDSLRPR
jgi:23S rRNA pseudouridine2605 synthase